MNVVVVRCQLLKSIVVTGLSCRCWESVLTHGLTLAGMEWESSVIDPR
jgi:hypothetical protein